MTKARDLANLGAVAAYSPTFRNRIINGSGIIGQRGTVTLSGASASYGADRWLAAISGGTGVTATTFKSTFGGSTSYSGIWINGTFTGIPYFAQRIEMQNCYDLNGSYVTVSGLAYQDTGSTQQMVVRLSKANGVDNFSGITALQTGTAFSVPSGVVTAFKQTFLLGSTDASNGLQLEIFGTGSITVTSKNFAVSDVQLEKGAVATPFEVRPIGVELALCQRYYQRLYVSARGYSMGATYAVTCSASWAPMRAIPTWSRVSGPSAQANVYSPNPYGQLIADSVNSGYYNLSAASSGDTYAVSVLFESTGTEL
jgi:hypothetical protein